MKFDHIELFVPNRQEAAAWYAGGFGFHIVEPFRDWSLEVTTCDVGIISSRLNQEIDEIGNTR